MDMIQRNNGFKWELMVVYGLVDHSWSRTILEKLHHLAAKAASSIVIGVDFNLVRVLHAKSNHLVNLGLIDLFQ